MSTKHSLPEADYYAVIFATTRSADLEGYPEMDEITMKLAAEQPGYLGYESVNNGDRSIFISYWESREAIAGWSRNVTHQMAKSKAEKWYSRYLSQVCRVESSREYVAGNL
jgi:heme-degrading monooxygenase HmoA